LNYDSGSFKYELEAPVKTVIERESDVVEDAKEIPAMRVIRGRPDPKELLA
jgi:hypothetical protein